MRELPQPKKATSCSAAQYDQRRDEVQPGTPAALSPLPDGRAAQSAGAGPVADRSAPSADGAGHGQSHLAEPVRPRTGEDGGGFRQPGRAAAVPGGARRAGGRVHRQRLECEATREDDRPEPHLPAAQPGGRPDDGRRSGQRMAGARPAVPPAGRDDSRQRAGRGGTAQTAARRPAGQPVRDERIVQARYAHRRRRRLSAQPVHQLAAHRPAAGAGRVRCPAARRLHRQTRTDRFALAGADPAERRAVRGSRAGAGRVPAPRGGRRPAAR